MLGKVNSNAAAVAMITDAPANRRSKRNMNRKAGADSSMGTSSSARKGSAPSNRKGAYSASLRINASL